MEIAIPLYDRFTALDAVGPYEVLWRLPGARVRWIGAEARPYATDRGLQLVDWIRAADATSTWTTSVCTGALLLGAAGILDGLRATTHWAYMDDLARYGAEPTSQRVVAQGKVVTSAGVSSGIDMALSLAAEIAGADVA